MRLSVVIDSLILFVSLDELRVTQIPFDLKYCTTELCVCVFVSIQTCITRVCVRTAALSRQYYAPVFFSLSLPLYSPSISLRYFVTYT